MAYFMNVIAIFIFSMPGCVIGQAQVNVQDIDNAEQFALLCRIYNVAKNPTVNYMHLKDPLKIVDEIDAINASLAEEKRPDKTENVGNSSNAQVKPTITREAAVAQAILRRITQKAHIILEDITNLNATRDIENVKAEFNKVIFGENGNENNLCQATVNGMDNRSKACGSPGLNTKGDSAGNNLVVDFFCLCSRRTDSDGVDQVCSVYVGGKGGHHGWSEKGPWGSSAMWASIKKGCGRLIHHHPKSTEEGREVLRDFLKHLKSGGVYRWGEKSNKVDGSNRKEGMLGTGAGKKGGDGNDILCDGKRGYTEKKTGTPPGGVCVYYGPNEWENDIPWLKQLKTALNTVDALNNKTATIQRDIEKLQMLQHRAEKIYETTKVITEIQNPVVPINLQTAAKRLTAYNAVWRHPTCVHFLAPWVLLL